MADWRNRLDQITNKMKHHLSAKGVDSMQQLQDVFLSFDANGNGTLDKIEFEEFMSKLGVFLARQELRVIFDAFDINKDGNVCYGELINALKSDMSDSRIAIIKQAWQQVACGKSSVAFEELVKRYNAPAHPRVVSREKKAETVFNDFVTIMGASAVAGQVSQEAFVDYYANINACLPAEKEAYFVDLVLKTWNISAKVVKVSGDRQEQLEDIIFEKIRQRTHGADDEGKTARKFFKHFDLEGYGTVQLPQFKKALETLGCAFKDFELESLFRKYDKSGDGKLDYEEFSAFFALMGTGNNPNVNPSFGATREPPNQVLSKVLDVLKSRGMHGIRGLGIVFRRMDNNGDRRMDRAEFMWGLKENGHTLSPSEFERIFKYFDKNNDGKINFDEFLTGVRGEMNDFRKKFVHMAYAKLDRTGDGVVMLDDLASAYDVSFHPKFKSGEMSKTDILTEFMQQWETCQVDGKVTREEFEGYFADVSASIDDDAYFELMIRNAWHIAGGEGQSANTTIPRHLVTAADGSQSVQMMKGSETFSYDKSAARFHGAEH